MAKIKANSTGGSFWSSLPRPLFVLAPMANVTDFAFRSMIAKYGKPDVMWTEFVSADGLCSAGKDKLLIDLKFSKKEKPIVAQLFTGHPEMMRKAAKLCAELGFDGIDINMGCPDRAVEKQGGGAAMIRDPKSAVEVLEAARKGWKDGKGDTVIPAKAGIHDVTDKTKIHNVTLDPDFRRDDKMIIPVTIKTRIGYNAVDFGWIKLLLEQNLPALTLHLRTRKEMSDVPAHWELMPEIIKLRDEVQANIEPKDRTLIIGNGDVESVEDGAEKMKKYGGDGVMIGRGIFGKPWVFENMEKVRNTKYEIRNKSEIQDSKPKTLSSEKTPEERLRIMLEHAKLYEKTFKGIKNFAVMKKHFKAYVSGWDGAKELRVKLMEVNSFKEVNKIVKEYLKLVSGDKWLVNKTDKSKL